jgi:hypothetical protein
MQVLPFFSAACCNTILALLCEGKKRQNSACVQRYWETIRDNLSKAGWSWGCVATVNREGRTIFVADAHHDDGKRFVVHAEEKLTEFLELERVTRESFRFPTPNDSHRILAMQPFNRFPLGTAGNRL